MEYQALKRNIWTWTPEKHFVMTPEGPRLRPEILADGTLIFVDPARSSGISIFTKTGEPIMSVNTVMIGDDLVQYKRELRYVLENLVKSFRTSAIYHEEVFASMGPNNTLFFESLRFLLSLREVFQEMRKDLNLTVIGLNNRRWKAALGKIVGDDKIHVMVEVSQRMKLPDGVPQDVIDSLGMGFAVIEKNAQVVSLPKRTKINVDLQPMEDTKDAAIYLLKNYVSKMSGGISYYEYNTSLQVKENALHALAYDPVVWTVIEEHRYYGQMMLDHNLRPSQLEGKFLLGVFYL